MTLDQYRQEKKLTYLALAKLLGFDQATMARRWCLPRAHPQSQTPSAKNMDLIIEYITNRLPQRDPDHQTDDARHVKQKRTTVKK